MKNLFLLVFLLAIFTQCTEKKEDLNPVSANGVVIFSVKNQTDNVLGQKKSTNVDTLPNCQDGLPLSYVEILLDNDTVPKKIGITNDGNTQPLTLSTGSHVLKGFVIRNDNNTYQSYLDDITLSVAPELSSIYGKYVDVPLPITFIVYPQSDVPPIIVYPPTEVGVICNVLNPNEQTFGSAFFSITKTKLHNLTIQGTMLISDKPLYDNANTPYSYQPGWNSVSGNTILVDAMMKIDVWVIQIPSLIATKVETIENTFLGKPIKVTFADRIGKTESYELVVYFKRLGSSLWADYFQKVITFPDTNIPTNTEIIERL
ncbi:MAG: hypothetical protein WCG45_01345 [bacterium]